MKIKGAIFDLDGTLVDTEWMQYYGWVHALKPLGIEFKEKDYYDYAGDTGNSIAKRIVKHYGISLKWEELISSKNKWLMNHFRDEEIKTMPFARQAIEFFKNKGIKVVVATGSPMVELTLKLKKAGLEKYFDKVVSSDDVKRSKPYSDTYIKAADVTGLKPDECIAFEDTEFGVRSAKTAGIKCLAIPNKMAIKQDFSIADGVFKNMEEAIVWIQKNIE